MFRSLIRAFRVACHPDTFTLTHEGKLATLRKWLDELFVQDTQVMLIAHFPATFSCVQHFLERTGWDHIVVPEPPAAEVLRGHYAASPKAALLSLSSILPQDAPEQVKRPETTAVLPRITLVVLEASPLLSEDERIKAYAASLQCKVRIGRLLSFEDPVLNAALGENYARMMEHLGLGRSDLVTSSLTSRALKRSLMRRTGNLRGPLNTHSAEEWLSAYFSGYARKARPRTHD